MEITRKERMRRAINYEVVDRIPTQINYTAGMGQKMADHFGVPAQRLAGFLRQSYDSPGFEFASAAE